MPEFPTLPLPVLLLIFALAAAAVWVAGIHLARATDILSRRWGMGEALGGLVLLAIVTNLPEIAITVSGALRQDLGLAVGNILGGIAVQTVVLAALDIFGMGRRAALTYQASSLSLVLEGLLVLAVLAVAIMGSQLPAALIFDRVTPSGFLIGILWFAGLSLISKSRDGLPWREKAAVPLPDRTVSRDESADKMKKASTGRLVAVFSAGAVVTLVCGVLLERSGGAIAGHLGMTGVLFGATILAAATSLPELSTGLASVRMGDYQLAVSDIFGGNAFLPVLFLLATLVSGHAVLPIAQKSDIYLTGLGMLLTLVYITGLLFRSPRQILRMGVDSLVVLVVYLLGMLGLFAMERL